MLVLEPDPEVRRLFGQMLTRLGHEPVLGVDAPSGCRLVLLEPGWPEGVERARAVLQDEPELPVVAASIFPSSVFPADIQFARHLVKPFTLRQLDQAIAEAAA